MRDLNEGDVIMELIETLIEFQILLNTVSKPVVFCLLDFDDFVASVYF